MSNEMLPAIDGKFVKLADERWESRLREAKEKWVKRSIPAFLEFCTEVYQFQQDCGSKRGGSEFASKGAEWLGASISQVSRWATVGEKGPELLGATQKLPASEDSICRIASLNDEEFARALPLLTCDTPQSEVREIIKSVQEPVPEPSPTDLDLKARKLQERLYKQFLTLPEKYQFIFAGAIGDYAINEGWDLS